MEDAFQGITEMFQAGAMIILKYLFLYIILPEFAAILVFGAILKFRGGALKAAMVLVTLVCFWLFVQYGLPQLSFEATALSQG